MSTNSENHWSATSNRITIGPVPASFFLPIPVLPFYNPLWFVILSLIWMGLTYWLKKKGLGLGGLKLIFRRWLQGRKLHNYK